MRRALDKVIEELARALGAPGAAVRPHRTGVLHPTHPGRDARTRP